MHDVLVYILNGFLLVWFWLVDHAAMLISIPAVGVVLLFDEEVARLASVRAGGRGPVRRHGHVLTLICGLLWLVAGSLFPTPVPFLGAGMWLLSALLTALLPAERAATLWRCKTSLLTYSLLLLGFRLYLRVVNSVSPYEWSGLVGSVDAARSLISRNVGLFTTIGAWASWFVLPVAHAAYAVQRLMVHPMSLTNPFATVRDAVEEIRTKGGDR